MRVTSLVIDQIFDSDYVHLRPAATTYFSDEEDELSANEKGKAGGSRKGGARDLEDLAHVVGEEGQDASASEEEGQGRGQVDLNSRIRKVSSSYPTEMKVLMSTEQASDDGDYEEQNRAKKVKR